MLRVEQRRRYLAPLLGRESHCRYSVQILGADAPGYTVSMHRLARLRAHRAAPTQRSAKWSRRRVPLRPTGFRAAALGVVCALAWSLAPLGVSAHTAQATPKAEGPEPSLHLAPTETVIGADAEETEFTLFIENPGPEALEEGRVALYRELNRATSTADLDAEFDRSRAVLIGGAEVGETPGEGETTLSVSIPAASLGLTSLDDEGVYRVHAQLQTAAGDDEGEADLPAPESTSARGDEEDTTGQAKSGGQATDSQASEDMPDPAFENSHTLTATTPVVWGGAGEAPGVQLSTVVPLVLPTDTYAMPSKDQLGAATARLTETLDAAEEAGSILAIDPRIIAGVRAYGSASPAASRELIERLERTPLTSFLLQFADADPAAQAALGFDELLAPRGLEYITRDGSFPADADNGADNTDGANDANDANEPAKEDSNTNNNTAPNNKTDTEVGSDTARDGEQESNDQNGTDQPDTEQTDTEQPDTEEQPGAPSLDELLAWPSGDRAAWPSAGEVDTATLDLIRSSGYDTVVIDSNNLEQAQAPHVQLDDFDALVSDSRLDAALGQAIGAVSETESRAGVASAAAELVLAAQGESTDPAHTSVAIDRGAVADSERTANVLDELRSLDWVDTTAFPVEPETQATLRAGSSLEPRIELLRAAVDREASVDAMSPLLEHPEYLTGYQRARLLGLFATRYAPADSGFDAAAERFRARDDELREGVSVVRGSHTQLVSTSSRVPVQVHNSLPFDAVVAGMVRPSSAALRITERDIEPTSVPGDGNENILVPVHARISSGNTGIVVTLTDANRESEFATEVIPISVNSSVETIALSVLGVLAATLLGLGVWRSVKRRSSLSANADDAHEASGIPEP